MNNIETINSLLRDELSATETYKLVLDKLREHALLGDTEVLFPIYQNHKAAVSSLQTQIRELGGGASEDTGVWGIWTKIVEESAIMLGKQTALKILQEGEKTGAVDYEQALKNHELSPECRSLIEIELLPAQRSHIRTLERLLDSL